MSVSETGLIEYTAGPTGARFHASNKFFRDLTGPVGGGKSVACVMEGIMRSMQQRPSADGVRRSRGLIARNCYDAKTEILTERRGWQFFKDLTEEDRVAQLKDGALEFVLPTYYYTAPYKGEMLGFENEGLDFLVTPDHKMYVDKLVTRAHVWEGYSLRHAKDIYGNGSYRVKRDASWVGESQNLPEAFAEWLGLWFAEGHVGETVTTDGYARKRLIVTQTKPHGIEYTRALFIAARIPFVESPRQDSGINFRVRTTTANVDHVGNRLFALLRNSGLATTKKLPFWLKQLTPPQLQAFIRGYIAGDGHVRKDSITTTIYTSSKQIADDLQEIALKAGMVANISSRDRIGNPIEIQGVKTAATAIEWTITLVSPKKYAPRLKVQGYAERKRGWYREDYDGDVYCVEVPTHVVYVRRNGRAMWCSQTFPELKSTTIKTWQEWVPEAVCPIVYDVPIRGTFKQRLGDGTIMELEVIFVALDRPEDVSKLLSLELTWAWLNEAREQDEEIFKYLRGRVGRYPAMKDGGPSWHGIFADTNAPKTTNWLYRVFEEETPPDSFELFKQPPAVLWDGEKQKWVTNPDAENLENLPRGYYEQQLEGNTDDYIRVMLAVEYGMSLLGKPVFPQYNEKDHVSKQTILPDRNMPLILGFDFGLHPACIFAQIAKSGGIRILDALSPADEDLESFVLDYVNPLLHKKYAQFKIHAVGDPAARGRSGLDKRTPFDVLLKFGNIRCVPAHTNNFIPRKEAVDYFLNRRDGFLLDPSITYLREAFGGGYVYEEVKGQRGKYKERPIKNEYSHGVDAVQYVALYAKGGAARRRSDSGAEDKNTERFLWA